MYVTMHSLLKNLIQNTHKTVLCFIKKFFVSLHVHDWHSMLMIRAQYQQPYYYSACASHLLILVHSIVPTLIHHTHTHTHTHNHTHKQTDKHIHSHSHTHTHTYIHTLTSPPSTPCTTLHVPQALQIKDPAFVVPEMRMAAEYLFAKAENDVKKRKGMIPYY